MDGLKFVSMIYVLFVCISLCGVRSAVQLLPHEEVEALEKIASKLQYSGWQPARDSCSSGALNQTIYVNPTNGRLEFGSNVACNCNNTVCHITNIQLRGLNLTGILPEEFVNLTSLQKIDLTRNYINGTIPARFGQLRITSLNLLGNRISGPIPEEIGEISTLEELVVEDNLLGGPLPQSIGRLTRLTRFVASANNFTGTIPESYVNLTSLTDFRIDGSSLSGRIPDFIGNWTNLTRLDLQGTSVEGPIPSAISLLTNLEELRITDLGGSSSMPFPNLQNMTKMERLFLRNCLLTGPIPEYVGNMTSLKNLDLSFNGLTGAIPDLIRLIKFKTLFLNNNSLSGEIPGWVFDHKENIDLSYNNFTNVRETQHTHCESSNVNLVSALSPSAVIDRDAWCLSDQLTCRRNPERHSLFINCGGPRTHFEGNEYAEDKTRYASSFHYSSEEWASTNNGNFMGTDSAPFVGGPTNVTGGDIYTTARFSPASLRYFGLCMQPGSYNVRLHFAEISYTDDMTFSALGRRYFDVSIQGDRRLINFNIMLEANGSRRGIYRDFETTIVNSSTIDIHLYWAGKGTTAIPGRGVYGPSLSAITITPNFKIPKEGGLSDGAVAGIVIASCTFILLILAILWWRGCIGGDKVDKELRGLELQTGYFSLQQIRSATNNFDPANKIGEGGFGAVYKGVLSDGTEIAVKQLSARSKQGNNEFFNEIGMLTALHHPNLVKLYGCCIEGKELLVVYEYLANNSLARALFGSEDQKLNLSWPTRKNISMGIARGLAYIHGEVSLKVLHRDIKSTNILLDSNLDARISDFGLAHLEEKENSYITTNIAGTIGYMPPEYAMTGHLTEKVDVYAFGIVLFEIISGKNSNRPKDNFVSLLDWAYVLHERGSLLEMVDPGLGHYSKHDAMMMLNLALLCTNQSPSLRPLMSDVVQMLDGRIPVQPPMIKHVSKSPEISADILGPTSTSTDFPFVDSSFYRADSNECSTSGMKLDENFN